MNLQKLKGKIKEQAKTQECVAEAIGIDRSTFYRKVKEGGDGFTVGELRKMISYIPLTKREAMDIFFA